MTDTLIHLSPDEVAALPPQSRVERVRLLIEESNRSVDRAIAAHGAGMEVLGPVVLYSGGNDSTVLAHIFRNRATHAAHANTGIGIEQTRQFVRDTCAEWGLPLIEKFPPQGSTYRELVLDQAFPGPGHHWKMYQRLKERCLRQVRNELVSNPRRQRVLFLAGRRRDESRRRANIVEHERQGSIIWSSPLVLWTNLDLNTYRSMHDDVPMNEVSALLHMSGECLCGAFAHKGELEEIRMWFPDVADDIEQLERDVLATGKFPEKKCRWGWGAYENGAAEARQQSKSGMLCSSCDARGGAE